MLAVGDMMKKQIVMPAHLMDDNQHVQKNGAKSNLFADFSAVAERTGTYNAFDYADIVDYLIGVSRSNFGEAGLCRSTRSTAGSGSAHVFTTGCQAGALTRQPVGEGMHGHLWGMDTEQRTLAHEHLLPNRLCPRRSGRSPSARA